MATVLFTGILTKERRDVEELMVSDPRKYYTAELAKLTAEEINRIKNPVFIVHSNVHPVNDVTTEMVVPAMRAANKSHEIMFVPGQQHGFYNGYVHAVGMRVYDALPQTFVAHRGGAIHLLGVLD